MRLLLKLAFERIRDQVKASLPAPRLHQPVQWERQDQTQDWPCHRLESISATSRRLAAVWRHTPLTSADIRPCSIHLFFCFRHVYLESPLSLPLRPLGWVVLEFNVSCHSPTSNLNHQRVVWRRARTSDRYIPAVEGQCIRINLTFFSTSVHLNKKTFRF